MDKTPLLKTVKVSLLTVCKKHVQQRIDNAQEAIASASDAAADDTKSSAGDKFETTREMMQQELSRHHLLLSDAKRMEQLLANIDIRVDSGPIRTGSLVTTDQGIFFIAISVGQTQVGEVTYWIISPYSPLGQRLVGLSAGQQVAFNGTTYQITAVA